MAALATACAGPQSALDPAGPAAGAIATGWWLMAAGALVAWALVLALAALAMRRRSHLAPASAGRMILAGGIVLPTTLLAALLVYGTVASDRITGARAQADLAVQVTARRWSWEFEYLDADGAVVALSIDELALPRGRMVEFRVDSEDVIHSFWIPRLGGKIDAIPGRRNVLRLRADAAGPMRGQCAEFCGLEHAHMAFDVAVLEPDEFARWLDERAVAGTGGVGR
ncbi:cytochrome c oxidase subunit 2 [Luteimonas sp. J16]|jgi:cytochrome c oxidase subunit 2|uniref:cytochrome c oxidase subunit II n=1 Tax=unclassified Luteimonas TaxID=2629088 RepID=UPI0004B29FA2|nr:MULTISPECIES: cytochrome c oxidase subunit II [unclassified Luteimonas]TWG92562.1 cytochrome c oxidase subunit 2 [Luteimonas sp. J16]